nr:methyl-accepting chemotaxis protein [Planosporangium thailandense]
MALRLRLMVSGAVVAAILTIAGMVVLVNQVSHQYAGLLSGAVRQSQDARAMEVAFKKQVQEWKDILLRGADPADLQTYSQQFTAQEKAVQALAAKLTDEVTDPGVSSEVDRFRDQHSVLSAKYRNAYQAFVASKGLDIKAADTAVRGQDRGPTDLIEKIVSDLSAQQQRVLADTNRRVREEQLIVVGGGAALILAVLIGLYFASRGIAEPVRTATSVLGDIASGDLTVSMTGTYNDEFEAIKDSINTAVEDLNAGLNRVVAGADRVADTSRFVESVGEQLIQSAQITRVSLNVIEQAVRGIDTAGGPANLARQLAEVRHALGAMATIADRNVRAAEDARRATSELRTNSDNLQRLVATYRLKPVETPAWVNERPRTPVAEIAAAAR